MHDLIILDNWFKEYTDLLAKEQAAPTKSEWTKSILVTCEDTYNQKEREQLATKLPLSLIVSRRKQNKIMYNLWCSRVKHLQITADEVSGSPLSKVTLPV